MDGPIVKRSKPDICITKANTNQTTTTTKILTKKCNKYNEPMFRGLELEEGKIACRTLYSLEQQ